jgi:predicted nuclease of predicted toxin-antitoxin system
MRASFLLDAHISPVVAELLAKEGLDARAIGGSTLMSAEDEELLELALTERRLFVTYDNATVPGAVAERLNQGLDVPGVVYVASATIASDDFSGLARALKRLAAKIEAGEVDPAGGVFLARA